MNFEKIYWEHLFESIYLKEKYDFSNINLIEIFTKFLLNETFLKQSIKKINFQFSKFIQEETGLDIRFVDDLGMMAKAACMLDDEDGSTWVEIPYTKEQWEETFDDFKNIKLEQDSGIYKQPTFYTRIDKLQELMDHELLHYQQNKKRVAKQKKFKFTNRELKSSELISNKSLDTSDEENNEFYSIYENNPKELDAFAKQTAREIFNDYNLGDIKGFNNKIFQKYNLYSNSEHASFQSYKRYMRRVYEFVKEFGIPMIPETIKKEKKSKK
jgi:hypothetical protein